MSRFFRSASERHSLIRESGASATMLNGHSGAEALAGAAVQLPEAGSKKPEKPFVAIQIGARSFVDEGVDKCLDKLQEKAMVNVLMPAVFTYGRGLSGRQM